MTLQDILDHLAYGEFSHLFMGTGTEYDSDNDTVMPAVAAKKILPAVTLGLTELHKRFLLNESKLAISLDGRTTYVLSSDKTVSNSGTDTYITDTVENPFLNDVMKVERILDDDGNELMFNKENNTLSIRATSYNTLTVPTDIKLSSGLPVTTLTVIYRADHPVVNKANAIADPNNTVINLPLTHLEALLAYIAARIVTPLGFNGEAHEGNNYMAKFERACQLLRAQGMQVDTGREITKLQDRGWV